ncbi:hypothetical protein [Chitinimonas sp.]|uniref:hypothetical protein n=1 Tax=Chitinimonas sp. TaxID=1934313 RepID=UPI0035B39D80
MRAGERGSVYLWLMGILVVMGLLLGKAVEVQASRAERQREAMVLTIGEAYRQAIGSYMQAPGSNGQYPTRLEDLLTDNRFPVPVHHLRQAYPDPETGGEWVLIKEGQAIVGVHSASTRAPFKRQNFPARYKDFESAATIGDWQFIYTRTAAKSP